MKPVYEAPAFAPDEASLTAFIRRERSFDWNWHYHPEIELTWIRRGRGRRLVGDHTAKYREGDLVLLGANLPHTWISDPRSHRNEAVVVQFRALPSGMLEMPEFAIVAGLLNRAGAGLKFANTAPMEAALLRLASLRGLPAWLLLIDILRRLSTGPKPEMLASAGYRHHRSLRLVSRLGQVRDHIEKNFRAELPLAEAARVAGLSSSAFSRLFHRMTNQTYVGYRNAVRVREACRLLIESDLPVTRIAGEAGFENLANFNRRFRERQGMTPREYRRLHERPDWRSVS